MRALALSLALAVAPSAPVGACARSEPAAAALERCPGAAERLAAADRARAELRGQSGPAREAARERALAAYRAVRESCPKDRALGAQAAFRCGELLRAADRTREARAELALARELGVRSEWGARAALEEGHVERRAQRIEAALARYEEAAAHAAADAGIRDAAALAIGSCHADEGRLTDAIRIWQRVAERGDDPLDRVRAYDLWALAYARRGDLEGGAGVLALCRVALAERAAELSEQGERVRTALESMRSITVLERAVAERRRARARSGRRARPRAGSSISLRDAL